MTLKKKVSDLRKQLHSALETKLVSPVTFRLANYKQMKEKKECWRSPYFYTHAQGYKLMLEGKANSSDDDANNHFSLYCYLGVGVNDDSLAWPFRGEITIQILNQSWDSGHHSEILDWDCADDDIAGKPNRTIKKSGWGFAHFISHADLEKESRGYLKNDCIYIRVLKVTFPKQWLACSVIPSSEIN